MGRDPSAGVGGTGFWKAVAAVKRSAQLVEEFAPTIAELDRKAFRRWALFTVSARLGTTVAAAATVFGLVVTWLGSGASAPWNGMLILAGMWVVLMATHGLAHIAVGQMLGIRFTHWFIGTIIRPQPGVKTDYASYLAASPRRRAWMHASGAIVSKVVPFAYLPVASSAGAEAWVTWLLIGVGVLSILTDIAWSTKFSDWKKFRRELAYATR